jgi:type IV pilus assembly protein PilW
MGKYKQTGFTLVELMIALLIGLFLLGGMSILVFENKRTFGSQNALTQLQDNERLGMSVMTDVIQTTGYFPNPTQNTATGSLAAAGGMVAGQAITGVDGGGPTGSTITVRYATQPNDGILDCSGSVNQSGAVGQDINTFSVQVNGGVSQLVCNLTSTSVANQQYVLVNNVSRLDVQYGVNSAGTGNNVDSYMTAAQVTANNDWNNVISVRLTITFLNPLSPLNGNTLQGLGSQPQFISVKRTIALLGKAGISS